MSKAAALWEALLRHVAGCTQCDRCAGHAHLCHQGEQLAAEFEEQERLERYDQHPDPAQAGLELMQAQGKARIIRVTPAQWDAITEIDRTDVEGFYSALQGILDEATFQSLAKVEIEHIQFETER